MPENTNKGGPEKLTAVRGDGKVEKLAANPHPLIEARQAGLIHESANPIPVIQARNSAPAVNQIQGGDTTSPGHNPSHTAPSAPAAKSSGNGQKST